MIDRPSRRILGIGALGWRIIIAFVAIALATAAAEVVVSSISATADFGHFARQQEVRLAQAAAVAAEDSYTDHGGWRSGQVEPVINLVSRFEAAVRITNRSGGVVGSSPGFATFHNGPAIVVPVSANGRRVGSAVLRFDHRGLAAATSRLEAERWHVRLYSAAIAILLALVVSVFIARRITAPIERILAAMRARGSGDRNFRIENVRAVGELGELLEGFNQATNSLDRQETVRRNLVANVAHELRTPVAILQAGHEAMLDGITEPTPENLGSLRDEVLRLSRVLEDLRALAAAEAAALQLNLVQHDLAEIAGDATAALADAFEMAGLKLSCQLYSAQVLCDYDRTREITTNLLTNALKYTERGGAVTVQAGPAGESRATLKVSDTGIGIPPDELSRVTERFFRGRRSAGMAAGTGFGLTIVAELVRAQHGDLDIRSKPGAGTQVTVSLPQSPTHIYRHGKNRHHWRA